MSEDEAPEELKSRALEVVYCPNCTLPPEYCFFGPHWDKCKPWVLENFPELVPEERATKAAGSGAASAASAGGAAPADDVVAAVSDLKLEDADKVGVHLSVKDGKEDEDDEDEEGEAKKKKSKRGGRIAGKATGGVETAAPTSSTAVPHLHISKSQRNKKKFITSLKGAETLNLNLKTVAQALSKGFACSASVSPEGDEILISGDVTQSLPEFMVSKYHVDKSCIYFVNLGVKKKAFP